MELEDYPGYMLRLAHAHAHELAEASFPDGPHPREYAVLTALDAAGPVSQQRLAERLHVNRTLMVGVADELERRGYVERRRDAADRRSYALHVTPAGTAALADLHDAVEQADDRITERLSAGERKRLHQLLRRILGIDRADVPAPLADRTGFLLSRAHFAGRERANRLLRPLGIVVRHFGLLALLDTHGPSSQQSLATRLSVSATMVTQIVDEVEALGLAERRRNPGDRRSYLVSLTPAGRRKLKAARQVLDSITVEITEAIGSDGERELHELLTKVVGV